MKPIVAIRHPLISCLTYSKVHGRNRFSKVGGSLHNRPDGGTGRRAGLKIRFFNESGSSTLPPGTIQMYLNIKNAKLRCIT